VGQVVYWKSKGRVTKLI